MGGIQIEHSLLRGDGQQRRRDALRSRPGAIARMDAEAGTIAFRNDFAALRDDDGSGNDTCAFAIGLAVERALENRRERRMACVQAARRKIDAIACRKGRAGDIGRRRRTAHSAVAGCRRSANAAAAPCIPSCRGTRRCERSFPKCRPLSRSCGARRSPDRGSPEPATSTSSTFLMSSSGRPAKKCAEQVNSAR